MSILPNTLKHGGMRSLIGTFLHIESPDQDQTETNLRNWLKGPKEFSLTIKSKKLHQETKDHGTS